MKKIILFLLLSVLGGCATARVALYHPDVRYEATDPKSIEVFQKKPEDRKFIEIGEVTVDGASSWAQVEKIFRIKAAEYGGNAVYVYKTTEQSSTYVTPHQCYFYEGDYYPRGHYHVGDYYRPPGYSYFPHYYYCYGYNDTQTVTFLTVIGIVIRYTEG